MMKTLSSGNCALSVPAKNSYRMVVLGASRVGKSAIVSRFLNGRFEDQYTPTIEDFHRKVYNIRGDMYQLDILDTSGNHPFPAMRRLSILTGAAGAGAGACQLRGTAPVSVHPTRYQGTTGTKGSMAASIGRRPSRAQSPCILATSREDGGSWGCTGRGFVLAVMAVAEGLILFLEPGVCLFDAHNCTSGETEVEVSNSC